MPDARCSWLWRSTTPWLPPDRHWPWPRAHPSESYTAAAADTTTSTPAALTTRTCYKSRHPSCTGTPRCPTSETIPPHLHHLATRADQSYHALTTMLDGTQPCRHPDVDHYGPAVSVDAINSFGVSA